jgi:hypothetical protein
LTNVGGAAEVYVGASGPNPFELRTFVAGIGIVLVQTATTIEIINADPGSVVTLTSAGGTETLVQDGTGPALASKGLSAGTGISLASDGVSVTITNSMPALPITLSPTGTGQSLVSDGVGPDLITKDLTAGVGIGLMSDANSVQITNTDPGSAVTLGSVGGETMVSDGTGPTLDIKGLAVGAGLSIAGSPTVVTVTNTDPGSAVTLTSAGGTETLVQDGTGPALANKGLTAGTGISLTGAATAVTIANTDPGSAVTLTSAGGTETLVNDGTGPALATKGLTAGTGVSLSSTASAVTISTAAVAGSMFKMLINGSDHSGSERTVKTAQTSQGCLGYVNIAAGSQTCKIQWKSVTNGNTSTITNRQLYAASNLGTTTVAVATGSITTTSSTYADMTTMSISLIAGEWIISFSCDIVPAP